jgi:hypothetical protein
MTLDASQGVEGQLSPGQARRHSNIQIHGLARVIGRQISNIFHFRNIGSAHTGRQRDATTYFWVDFILQY